MRGNWLLLVEEYYYLRNIVRLIVLLIIYLDIRRKVGLKLLIGITISTKSFEFGTIIHRLTLVLHFTDDYNDDDLRLYSERRAKVFENLIKVFSIEFKQQIPAFKIVIYRSSIFRMKSIWNDLSITSLIERKVPIRCPKIRMSRL